MEKKKGGGGVVFVLHKRFFSVFNFFFPVKCFQTFPTKGVRARSAHPLDFPAWLMPVLYVLFYAFALPVGVMFSIYVHVWPTGVLGVHLRSSILADLPQVQALSAVLLFTRNAWGRYL